MKIEWLVIDVTAVGYPDTTEHAIWGVVFAGNLFWPIQAVFIAGDPLCDARTSS